VARTLASKGYKNLLALKGGWDAWVQGGGQMEPKEKK
jgi:rhodanese-related sulfurtransferase